MRATRSIVFEDDAPTLDERRAAALANLRAVRRARAERLLKAWLTKQKRATTMVRKLRRTVAYYLRSEGA